MLKQGICIDCGPESKPTTLIAKRCNSHYWQHRAAVNIEKRKNKPETLSKFDDKKALDKWFGLQINLMPKHCENCGEYLNPYAPWGARAYVCHIVPKATFETVKTHPLNRWFGCIQCHGDYDNRGEDKVAEMKIIPVVQQRFKTFLHLLNDDEFKRIPKYLMIEI